MLLLMLVTLVVATGQLCVVGAWSRSVRFSTVLRAAMVGFLVCGPVVAGMEWVFTGLPHRLGMGSVSSLVSLASWTWDPFLEELLKVLPLVLLAWRWPSTHLRLGWTDHLLLGAGLGAGFALFESALRYSQVPRFAFGGTDGYVVVDRLAQTVTVPPVWESLTTWLPTPVVYGAGWLSSGAADAISHLPWTALTAIGVAWWTRCHGGRRLLAVAVIVLVGALHACYNATAMRVPFASTWACQSLSWLQHRMGTMLVLVLIACVVADRLAVARARVIRVDMLLPGEPASGLNPLPMLRTGLVAAPWSTIAAWCIILQRRAAFNAMATGIPTLEACDGADRQVRQLARATDSGRWRDAARQLLVRPRWSELLTWQRVLWLLASLPSLAYLVVGGFPATRGLQTVMTGSAGVWIIACCLIVAIGLTMLSLPGQFRALRAQIPNEDRLSRVSRLLCSLAAMVVSVAMIVRAVRGGSPSAPLVSNGHALDALGTASFILGLVLILAAFIFFPPGGAIMEVALAGGMAAPVLTEAGVAFAGVAIKGAAFLAAGLLLMASQPDHPTSSGNSQSSGRPGTDTTGSTSGGQPQIPKQSLDDLPANVRDIYERYQKGGWKGNVSGQTPGTKAGKPWGNDKDQLPTTDAQGKPLHYREFDVNNRLPGRDRDQARFVRCNQTGTVYYTSDHYMNLVEVIPR